MSFSSSIVNVLPLTLVKSGGLLDVNSCPFKYDPCSSGDKLVKSNVSAKSNKLSSSFKNSLGTLFRCDPNISESKLEYSFLSELRQNNL